MFKELDAHYVINFEQGKGVKNYLSDIQNSLASFFPKDSYGVIGIPSGINLPPEIPRITAISPKGHTRIQISETQIDLNTAFDKEYNSDFAQCMNYLTVRINKINEIAQLVSYHKISYAGIVASFINTEITNPTEYIKREIFNGQSQEFYDILARFTFVNDNTFYKNISIDNARSNKNANDQVLRINLDVNNRYRFNTNKGDIKYTELDELGKLLDVYRIFHDEWTAKLVEES